ncbi:MAG: AMP-binding protein [Acidocella sp.]|nr:AMP-binding protein [Acidocella sp.]
MSDDDIAQILYTSGTTGTPKGAALTHRALLSEYASCIIGMGYTEDEIFLGALPLYHSAPMHAFAMPLLLTGAEILLMESPVPAICLERIARDHVTSMFCPPTVWISLLRHPDFATRDLSSLKKAYYGAAIMPVPVLQELRARLPGILPFNCYGQSEIAPLATILQPHEHDARPASVGRPVLNVETRVVDLNMQDMPPGSHGEIIHRSPHLMRGYWDKPIETAQAFAGGWFHSGDVGYFDAEGYLYIVDRIKDVINTGGVQVASREVEDALFTHPAIAEVAVIAIPDPKWIAHASQCLAPYKRPKQIFFTDALPKNTAGKLLKRQLRLEYAGTASAVLGIGP